SEARTQRERGNQPRYLTKMMIRIRPDRKLGIDSTPKEQALIARSTRPPLWRADHIASGIDTISASASPISASCRLTGSALPMRVVTGSPSTIDLPRSPLSALEIQSQ